MTDDIVPTRTLRTLWLNTEVVLAAAPQLLEGSVVSHRSAAVLHGLPVWASAIEKVHVTCDRSGQGKRRSVVHVHGAPLPASDLTVVEGVVVTSRRWALHNRIRRALDRRS